LTIPRHSQELALIPLAGSKFVKIFVLFKKDSSGSKKKELNGVWVQSWCGVMDQKSIKNLHTNTPSSSFFKYRSYLFFTTCAIFFYTVAIKYCAVQCEIPVTTLRKIRHGETTFFKTLNVNSKHLKQLNPQRDYRKFLAMQWNRQNTLLVSWDYLFKQCCGSGRFLTGSGSEFGKRPDQDSEPYPVSDPDPDLNKFSAKFLLGIFKDENML
jgi:hypothetical protein